MLKEQFCTESACVPGANEDVRVCCWLILGDYKQSYLQFTLKHSQCCNDLVFTSTAYWSQVRNDYQERYNDTILNFLPSLCCLSHCSRLYSDQFRATIRPV